MTGDGFDVRSTSATYPDGFRISAHAHPWGQLIYARRGLMRVTAGAMVWFTPATSAVWAPPGVAHTILMQGETAMRTLYIAPGRARILPTEAATLQVSPLLRELVLHVLAEDMLDPTRPEHDRLAAVLVDLIAAAPRQDLALPLPADGRARVLADRLLAAPGEGGDLVALAREAGASLRTLQRIFPRETGMSLELWRRKARLVHAAAALAGGASVTAAGAAGGYDSLSAFIQAFSRVFGTTPGRYRRLAA